MLKTVAETILTKWLKLLLLPVMRQINAMCPGMMRKKGTSSVVFLTEMLQSIAIYSKENTRQAYTEWLLQNNCHGFFQSVQVMRGKESLGNWQIEGVRHSNSLWYSNRS